tara:strand:- start:3089 stop:4147 length:1059 start_codon:yes stop_codon:yes gene_type:complete
MNTFIDLKNQLKEEPKKWLITGVAGFIGSNLLEALLSLDQVVIGIDNFSTGHKKNLAEVKDCVSDKQWGRFNFVEGDICNIKDCNHVCSGVDYVLHHAALGSVPRSIKDPIATNKSNIDGFLNMLVAAKDAEVKNFIYAASSSTYGDHEALPKIEDRIGKPLSPYAITKYVNELYADIFASSYDFKSVGLRYFNVFGPRQDPMGAYAAVIPKWISSMLNSQQVMINGDGETSRDFCYVANVVQANIRAALVFSKNASDIDNSFGGNSVICNIAVGERTTLNQLFNFLQKSLKENVPSLQDHNPIYRDFRDGDVRHSLADITRAKSFLGYKPEYDVFGGLHESINWYINKLNK